jgi:hypothetical protein
MTVPFRDPIVECLVGLVWLAEDICGAVSSIEAILT